MRSHGPIERDPTCDLGAVPDRKQLALDQLPRTRMREQDPLQLGVPTRLAPLLGRKSTRPLIAEPDDPLFVVLVVTRRP